MFEFFLETIGTHGNTYCFFCLFLNVLICFVGFDVVVGTFFFLGNSIPIGNNLKQQNYSLNLFFSKQNQSFRSFEKFEKKNRVDAIDLGQIINKIQAILAVFWPFEEFRKILRIFPVLAYA